MYLARLCMAGFTALIAAGCTADVQHDATAPHIAVRQTAFTGAICDVSFRTAVYGEQLVLFDGATLATAQSLWNAVVHTCQPSDPGLAAARESMLAYVRFTINAERDGLVRGSSPEQSIVNHWNPAFNYVGYSAPAVPPAVLEATGAANVVLASEGQTEFGIPEQAAMTVFTQSATGVAGGRLFTILPSAANCLGSTSLVTTGPCFEFSVYPAATVPFNPKIKLGICVDLSSTTLPALGHLSASGLKVVDPASTGVYPSGAFCHTAAPLAQYGGFTGLLDRLSSFSSRLLTVQVAYAAHGGLGGVTESLSPFEAIERRVFGANFDNASVGSTPSQGAGSGPGFPEIGTWSKVFASPPGSILVQNAVGTAPGALSLPVVLRQGGGACRNSCGGLNLSGELRTSGTTGAFASSGVYEVRWRSLQSGPTLKGAPFVLRSFENLEIARVTYAQQSSVNQLLFNGVATTSRWTRNISQLFVVTVNLNTRSTSLEIDGVAVAGAQGIPFVSGANNLHRVQAEFNGIDSGVMAWDNIEVNRLADQ